MKFNCGSVQCVWFYFKCTSAVNDSSFISRYPGIGINGEVLVIHNVSRYCGDIYECVAFNGVHPASNRLISVDVQCK